MSQQQAQIESLLEQAQHLCAAGRAQEAVRLCARVLTLDAQQPVALQQLAALSLSARDFEAAAGYLRRYCRIEPRSIDALHALGVALEGLGERNEALGAYRRALRIDPANALSCLYLGSLLEDMGDVTLAGHAYGLAVDLAPNIKHYAHPSLNVPEPIRIRAIRANRLLHKIGHELHAEAVARAQARFPDADLSRAAGGLWRKLHDGEVPFATLLQQPMGFFLPDLPARPWVERNEVAWIADLEAECDAIAAEVAGALNAERDVVPYIHGAGANPKTWGELIDSPDWGAVHFYNAGVRQTVAFERFPHTGAVIDSLPVFRIDGRPVEALISVLRPHTRIPPHFGFTNVRLTVHLPLIVPKGCGVKVGDEARATERGRCLLFDDSFRHEAWNDSDDLRIVLIVEAWHPDLSAAERAAIEASFMAFEAWEKARDPAALLGEVG